ncbi:hypothetical protein [Haloarchaeobius sp. DYHT-AS-18]|uniref:hypothetical protein n=1 Tax=Haloarchaeobius sp. DYHT-AS-18 TaxID=3446117 RepID=UPI003EBD767D
MSDGSSRLRRIATVFAVLVIVGQVTLVAPAAASTPDNPCQEGVIEFIVDGGIWGHVYDAGRCNEAQQFVNATHADLYASSLALEDLEESNIVALRNHLEDARTSAKTIAKAEALEQFKNGSNRSEAKAAVNQSLEDYYVTLQRNLLEVHRSNVNQMIYIIGVYNNNSLPDSSVGYGTSNTNNAYEGPLNLSTMNNPISDSNYEFHNGTQNATLLNGSNVSIPVIKMWDTAGTFYYATTNPDHSHSASNGYILAFGVSDPDDYTSGLPINYTNDTAGLAYDGGSYHLAYSDIEVQFNQTKTNGSAYVDALYDTYGNYSEVNVTEVLDPITLTSEWSTNLNTTGSYGWIAAEMGLAGLEGNVNSSFTINYTPHAADQYAGTLNGSGNFTDSANITSVNMSGTLFTGWAPSSTNGTFERGMTYNTSNADAPVYFVNQSANSSTVIELDGEFTIESLVDVTSGNEINSTTLESRNQQTWNASSTREEMISLLDYRDQVIDNYDTGGGGGGSLFEGVSFGGAAIGSLVAIAGLLLLADRSAS